MQELQADSSGELLGHGDGDGELLGHRDDVEVVIVLALLTVRRELISKRFKFETVLMGYFLSIVISSS